MYFKIHLNIKLMSQLYPKNVYQYQQRMDDITGPTAFVEDSKTIFFLFVYLLRPQIYRCSLPMPTIRKDLGQKIEYTKIII